MIEEKEWIESPEGWNELEDNDSEQEIEEECYGQDLFADKDSRLSYQFRVGDSNGSSLKTIQISGFELHSDETTKSTGVTLWEGSKPLAKYMMNHSKESIQGRKVLELGSGLGLCGIVAHHLGAKQVVLTDGDTNALRELRKNVEQNCGSTSTISCRQLFWGGEDSDSGQSKFLESFGTFDTIIASDVIYTPTSIDPLFDTIQWAMKEPGGHFLLSWFTRVNNITIEMILEAARKRNLEW
eukprot:CAMPEP_0194227714 /NCGR_PEP_ID=MMETSP0156-20130528/43003_1 /TAXON_ID=33649 /ORGANISM="Thalassionema nitzschioides, Strain L26-B" /LENGTH=239 /DNA_ID=CAMNT_0038960207 /DNA_START=25 /DNA_END=741 /DNA_ORIENTATION=-